MGGFAFVEAHSLLSGAGHAWPSPPFELKEDNKRASDRLAVLKPESQRAGRLGPEESARPLVWQRVSSLGDLSPEQPPQRFFQKGNEGGSWLR